MAGIYIHIPFCKKKCIYCDFFSVASSPEKIADYAECLKKEYACRAKELGCGKVSTVYFGGGTPSLLPPRVVEELLGCLTGVVPEAEISFEMNPDDVTDAYAESLRHIGVNRISMGVQSFSDKELAFLNRRHDAQQVERAVGILRRAGFENISIDLIYGIPGQTLDSWRASLQKAVSLSLPHLSTYCLMYEEGTRMTRMRNRGDFEVCADDLCVVMYEEARFRGSGFRL